MNVEAALAEAQRNRPELAELTAKIARDDVQVTLAKDGLKPRLDLVAGYTMRGLAGDRNTRALSFSRRHHAAYSSSRCAFVSGIGHIRARPMTP